MKNSKKSNTLIIVLGIFVLIVFTFVGMKNVSGSNEYLYYTDVIKNVYYNDGKLELITRDDIVSVCVKITKTIPTNDSLCWVDTINNEAITSIYENKTYHIWAMDKYGIISYYNEYNTQKNK